MDTLIPECIRPLLNDYLLSLQIELPGLIEGFYIHGSIALILRYVINVCNEIHI